MSIRDQVLPPSVVFTIPGPMLAGLFSPEA